jgi:hypothetical protein
MDSKEEIIEILNSTFDNAEEEILLKKKDLQRYLKNDRSEI